MLVNKKLLGYAAGAITAAIGLYQLFDHVYDNGYKAAVTDIQSEYNVAIEQQRKEYERLTQEAIDTLSVDHAAEVARLRAEVKTEVVTKEVIKYVTDTITVSADCEPLAADVVSVLDKATSIIAGTTAGSGASN